MQKIIWAAAIFLGLLLGFLLFYRPTPLTERKQLEAEAEMHKVKRITPKQIEVEALRLGDSLVHAADSLLHMRLAAAFAGGGIAAALEQYPPQQYPELQTITQKYGVTMSRTGQKLAVNATKAARVQVTNQTEMLYTRGIYVNNVLCLKCHGTVGPEVTEAALTDLKQAYPDFKATGYKNGDMMGSWQIKLDRQPILERLSRRTRRSLRPQ